MLAAVDVVAGAAPDVPSEPLADLLPLALSLLAEAVSDDPAAVSFFAPVLAPLAPLLPPRKSVTYQPEPFSWKPAAVTCLRKVSFWHSGHCVKGESLIFCSTSFWKPHDSQR
ncbi:protein of unknown function [Paraburkholderia kururiensis]